MENIFYISAVQNEKKNVIKQYTSKLEMAYFIGYCTGEQMKSILEVAY